jgi:Mce-associated membrane protein
VTTGLGERHDSALRDSEGMKPMISVDTEPSVTDDLEDAKNKAGRRIAWSRILAYGVLPLLAMALATAAGYLKWQDGTARDTDVARVDAVQTARDATTALLSYQPVTADRQLGAAGDLLTGTFKDSYTQLTHDVVIPGAKQKQISAVANVAAAASVSASPSHAVVLVFIDQTVIVGKDAPAATSSAVRVTMDKIGARWLISAFDPV